MQSLNSLQNLSESHYAVTQTLRYLWDRLSPQVGDYKSSARTSDFNGWLICDRRSLSRETYAALFDIVGTNFGADDEFTFKMPDFRGRVFGAVGSGPSLTSRELGDSVGTETHTLSTNELPSHTHTGTTSTDGSHTHTTNDTGGQGSYGLVSANGTGTGTVFDNTTGELDLTSVPIALNVNSAGSHSHKFTTNAPGGGLAHNNMQPTTFGGNVFIYSGTSILPPIVD